MSRTLTDLFRARSKRPQHASPIPFTADPVEVTYRSGVYAVTLDGQFQGDYFQKDMADAAADALRKSRAAPAVIAPATL
jgi:hypothetical protein